MNAPTPDDEQPMREALQRDAARVSEPPFNATLHHDTMRRLRALSSAGATKPWFATWPALATAAAILTMATILALRPTPPSPHQVSPSIAATARPTPPRASLLAYQAAARDGDATLFAALDRDAATLLPTTSPVFNVALR